MASLSSLRQKLIESASINPAEGLKNSRLDSLISAAVLQHNPNHNVASLPSAEEELVVLLAWSAVCYFRASKAAPENNASGTNGFAQDRNTPYYKNVDLAQKLYQDYVTRASAQGVNASKNSVVVSTLLKTDPESGRQTPYSQSLLPAFIEFTATVQATTDTFVLAWNIIGLNEFYDVFIYHTTGDEPLHVPWNVRSDSGIPGIKDGAERLWSESDKDKKSIRLTDIDRDEVNRFLLVVRNSGLRYAYSTEIVIPAL